MTLSQTKDICHSYEIHLFQVMLGSRSDLRTLAPPHGGQTLALLQCVEVPVSSAWVPMVAPAFLSPLEAAEEVFWEALTLAVEV